MVVKWSRRALGDLVAIISWIERDNVRAAQALMKNIRTKTKRLADFPFMGRMGVYGDIRECVVHKSYIVSYRVRRDSIEIIQVWHMAQKR